MSVKFIPERHKALNVSRDYPYVSTNSYSSSIYFNLLRRVAYAYMVKIINTIPDQIGFVDVRCCVRCNYLSTGLMHNYFSGGRFAN